VVYDCLIYLSFNAGLLLARSTNPKVADGSWNWLSLSAS